MRDSWVDEMVLSICLYDSTSDVGHDDRCLPSCEKRFLLCLVFNANSIGKWIYDWTVWHGIQRLHDSWITTTGIASMQCQ